MLFRSGTFTYTTSPGLSINSLTGTISPASSTTNSYNVVYTTPNCPVTASTTVDITAAPTASFDYAGKPFCQSDGAIKSVSGFSGDASGTYSASPAGLSINSSNGDITPSTSVAGIYTVTTPYLQQDPVRMFLLRNQLLLRHCQQQLLAIRAHLFVNLLLPVSLLL